MALSKRRIDLLNQTSISETHGLFGLRTTQDSKKIRIQTHGM
jgi:hypothetical protein